MGAVARYLCCSDILSSLKGIINYHSCWAICVALFVLFILWKFWVFLLPAFSWGQYSHISFQNKINRCWREEWKCVYRRVGWSTHLTIKVYTKPSHPASGLTNGNIAFPSKLLFSKWFSSLHFDTFPVTAMRLVKNKQFSRTTATTKSLHWWFWGYISRH